MITLTKEKREEMVAFTELRLVLCKDDSFMTEVYEAALHVFNTPPAPNIPEKLTCDVSVAPNITFRKGVKTQTLLNYLTKKSEYSNEGE